MQVQRSPYLGRQHRLHPLGRELVDQLVLEHPGGVEDHRQRRALGEAVQERLDLLALADVARDDHRLRTDLDELTHQLASAWRALAATTGEHDPLDASSCQPARQVSGHRAGPTCEQSRSPDLPALLGSPSVAHLAGETADEDAGCTDRELVLLRRASERVTESVKGDLAQLGGEVHEPSPPLRILDPQHLSQAPCHPLIGRQDTIALADRHGTLGGDPDRRAQLQIGEGLREQERPGEAGRQGAIGSWSALLQSQQRQDSAQLRQIAVVWSEAT